MGKVAVMPKYPCTFCRKNEATQLCDFVVGYSWTSAKDERGRMIGRYHETCDNAICKECAQQSHGLSFVRHATSIMPRSRSNMINGEAK